MQLKHRVRRVGFFLFLSVLAGAQEQLANVEFILFSGRPRPRAVVKDVHASTILDSIEARLRLVVPCSEIPPVPSTPLYTGVLLNFSTPVLGQKHLVVREGYISYDTTKPCYRDPGSNLEKLAATIAFHYDDIAAPGGPKPMGHLACAVPDSLHPDIAPCVTGLYASSKRQFRSWRRPTAASPMEWAVTLDGRRTGIWRSGFYGSFPIPQASRKP